MKSTESISHWHEVNEMKMSGEIAEKSSVEYSSGGGDGVFSISEFDKSVPFSSFFPGIAGPMGVPLWAFYVNRGQCVCAFGTGNKDGAIMEFQPATKAYSLVSTYGFRTFLEIQNGNDAVLYEPFACRLDQEAGDIKRTMRITPWGLFIEEVNRTLGLKTEVEYFTLPGEKFAAMVRRVTVHNLSGGDLKIRMLDGIPSVIPYGITNEALKFMGRTIEAWTHVDNLKKNAPFFRVRVLIEDSAEVQEENRGNFYFAVGSDGSGRTQLPVAVDPVAIFGEDTSFRFPVGMIKGEDLFSGQFTNRMPSAMACAEADIPSGGMYSIDSITGMAPGVKALNSSLPVFLEKSFLDRKARENRNLILGLMDHAFVSSAIPEFNDYCRQSFLDNLLRGGFPHLLEGVDSNDVLYLYSRKHGDLERDYNNFLLQPRLYSQGNGNYRDINQNRRNDVWINPAVGSFNIHYFMNLIQLDGYNPLVVQGLMYRCPEGSEQERELVKNIGEPVFAVIRDLVRKSFLPDQLVSLLYSEGLELRGMKPEVILGTVLSCSIKEEKAEHGEGYWVDHWYYNLDLIDSYAMLFPDRMDHLMWEEKFSFYDDAYPVQNLSDKTERRKDVLRQYGAVVHNEEKERLINSRSEDAHKVRVDNGEGEIFYSSLYVKLYNLMLNKLSLFDPSGTGIEMEAGKPGWNDSLNGLPGLFGSSMPEVFELLRLVRVLLNISGTGTSVEFPEEIHDFFNDLDMLLEKAVSGRDSVWEEMVHVRQKYRSRILFGLSGKMCPIETEKRSAFLQRAESFLRQAVSRGRDPKTGLYHTYFINTISEKQSGLGFEAEGQQPLPLFLEAQMHAMNVMDDEVEEIYKSVRQSSLYDRKLGMYRLNASLDDFSLEIGRARVFTPGWLENESVFLHMHYKYLLSLLKSGLTEQFFREIRDGLIPFKNPEEYGRSIYENSSFLVSSCNPDSRLHGRGFSARLSGSTAEVFHMVLLMGLGKSPFQYSEEGGIVFKPDPQLPGWMFSESDRNITWNNGKHEYEIYLERGTFACSILGRTLLVYHNYELKDTFGKDPAGIVEIKMEKYNNEIVRVAGGCLARENAIHLRNGDCRRLDIFMQ